MMYFEDLIMSAIVV